jgi:Asp-tRNA(Asn)/Glu-tRNA(Gln) amidotransferase A subunit family amidase
MAQAFDPDFGSALEAAEAIRSRKVSSVELTNHIFRRIDAFQPKLNAYVYELREDALRAAREADETLARNASASSGRRPYCSPG